LNRPRFSDATYAPSPWQGWSELPETRDELAAYLPRQFADPWPALPEEAREPDASWQRELREWERSKRLDEEQRGDGWSVLPF
jgi:hypothetical protein